MQERYSPKTLAYRLKSISWMLFTICITSAICVAQIDRALIPASWILREIKNYRLHFLGLLPQFSRIATIKLCLLSPKSL